MGSVAEVVQSLPVSLQTPVLCLCKGPQSAFSSRSLHLALPPLPVEGGPGKLCPLRGIPHPV